MRDDDWSIADTIARDLAERRVDPALVQAVTGYLVEHRDADDFFALLDDLAGAAGQALEPAAARAGRFEALRASCQLLRGVPAETLPEVMGWAARLARYHLALLPPPARAPAAPARPREPVAKAPGTTAPPMRPAGPPARPVPGPRPGAPAPAAATPPERRPGAPRPRPPVPPARPAEAPPPPAAPQPAAQRRQSMADMLEALRAQFNAQRVTVGTLAQPRRDRAETQRERLRREQQEIQERYRREREQEGEEQ